MVRWVIGSILAGGRERCSSMVRAFAHSVMGRRIGSLEIFIKQTRLNKNAV